MQVAGSQCSRCNGPITFADEGKYCSVCGFVTHLHCERATDCPACGRPFEQYHVPKADPLANALDPRQKHSLKSIGPLLAAFLGFLGVLIVYYVATLD